MEHSPYLFPYSLLGTSKSRVQGLRFCRHVIVAFKNCGSNIRFLMRSIPTCRFHSLLLSAQPYKSKRKYEVQRGQ